MKRQNTLTFLFILLFCLFMIPASFGFKCKITLTQLKTLQNAGTIKLKDGSYRLLSKNDKVANTDLQINDQNNDPTDIDIKVGNPLEKDDLEMICKNSDCSLDFLIRKMKKSGLN